MIGLDVPDAEQRSILERLDFDVDEGWHVTVPTFRARDVTREIDVIEEVARVVLDRVPNTMPLRRAVAGHLSAEQRFRRVLEDVLVGAGYSEAYTWSLVPVDPDPAALRLPDPMSSKHAVLRTTLLHGLLEAARVNVDAGNPSIRLFEMARVYLPSDERLPNERWSLGGIAEGGFAAARGALEAIYGTFHLPLETRRTTLPLHPEKPPRRTPAGWASSTPALLEGTWGVFELDVAHLMAPRPERVLYEEVITYPPSGGVAVVVDEDVAAGSIVAVAREAGGAELRDAHVFDVYDGDQVPEGRKSVAVHLVFQASDRTLTDEEADAARARVVEALRHRFGAELRG